MILNTLLLKVNVTLDIENEFLKYFINSFRFKGVY